MKFYTDTAAVASSMREMSLFILRFDNQDRHSPAWFCASSCYSAGPLTQIILCIGIGSIFLLSYLNLGYFMLFWKMDSFYFYFILIHLHYWILFEQMVCLYNIVESQTKHGFQSEDHKFVPSLFLLVPLWLGKVVITSQTSLLIFTVK